MNSYIVLDLREVFKEFSFIIEKENSGYHTPATDADKFAVKLNKFLSKTEKIKLDNIFSFVFKFSKDENTNFQFIKSKNLPMSYSPSHDDCFSIFTLKKDRSYEIRVSMLKRSELYNNEDFEIKEDADNIWNVPLDEYFSDSAVSWIFTNKDNDECEILNSLSSFFENYYNNDFVFVNGDIFYEYRKGVLIGKG